VINTSPSPASRAAVAVYAGAVSILIFAISMVLALLYQRFVLRRDVEGALT